MKTLETERLILRDWELTDLDDFSELWLNPNVTIPHGDSPKHSKGECMPMLQYLISAKNNYALELRTTGKIIGTVGLNDDADNNPCGRNLGYMLNEAYWNHGYMQEALNKVIANASEITSFLSAGFWHDNKNEKSQHIINKLGFRYGKTIAVGERKLDYYILVLPTE
ncbi:MAG: GNAT family N-acetyltransferase [Defluviitaleaceae bacterium]|nr:GNAT family N-acetyltransferase [Defluviitaleaceae bacterium]